MSVAAVVLAAGFSRRLGRPKQLLVIDGETLVERAVRIAREAGCAPVIVVTRAELGIVRQDGVVYVDNAEAAEGMASSVRAGVAAVPGDGVVLMTCDQPGLSAAHLRLLMEDVRRVCASEYAGRRGVPAYFPRAAFAQLLQLRGDAGARALLRDAACVRDEALAVDVDTREDVAGLGLL